MKDLRRKLDKLRADAKDFALMSMSATDPEKRELFGRLADQLAIEALELEQIVRKQDKHLDPDDQHNVVDFKAGSERGRRKASGD
jgi:hypothetical protein